MPKKRISKKLKEFSFETRFKSSHDFKNKILNLFKDYIKSIIVFGAIVRGDITGKSDVDTYIIFDDTRLPLKKFDEIRSKVDDDIYKIARETDPRLHPQPVIALTEFMDGIRLCHPIFYTIIRDGYAIYDTGFFIPMRKLLEWGKFAGTAEAAELRMSAVPKRIVRVKDIKNLMVAEDLFYAVLDSTQAVLMYIGVGPPAPKVAAREMQRHLVSKGLLEEEYAQIMEDIFKFRKKIEHKEQMESISGKDLDDWIERTEKFVNRIEKLLSDLEMQKKTSIIQQDYEMMLKASIAALKSIDKLPADPNDISKAFHEHLIEAKLVNPTYASVLSKTLEMRKMLEEKNIDKIAERDVYLNREYIRRFVIDIKDMLEKSKSPPQTILQAQKNITKEVLKLEQAKEKIERAKELIDSAKDADAHEEPTAEDVKEVKEIAKKLEDPRELKKPRQKTKKK